MKSISAFAALAGYGLLLIALCYPIVVLVARWRWHAASRSAMTPALAVPVTIFKPLCGAEIGLYENLRTFCEQDYPDFEILFGVHSAGDAALAVVHRLIAQFPEVSIKAIVDERLYGSNRKVSNLLNMIPHARHDYWVFSDSDAEVTPDYLRTVTAPLRDEGVGLVTCPYRDLPGSNLWSRLAAQYVNDWFMPSVILAWALGQRDYVSGQTIALRRDTMALIGGLGAVRDLLADDYGLGEQVRRCGRSIVLSHYTAGERHHERSLWALIQHETRWLRTIAVLRPGSFRGLFLTFSLPLACLGSPLAAACGRSPLATLAMSLVVIALRLAIHCGNPAQPGRSRMADAWLIPLRDALTALVWVCAFRATRLTWRGVEFRVAADGVMRPTAERLA